MLAGIFAYLTRAIGAVDATVNMTLQVVPPHFVAFGLFLASCLISVSIGTSVGTIAALVPLAAGLAERTGADLALMVAVVVGGAFFGDNLSFISDTTIAATQSQGCRMKDKFRQNLVIVLPAAIITSLIYLLGPSVTAADSMLQSYEWYDAVPYFMVIIIVLLGVDVLIVLLLGIVVSVCIGAFRGLFDVTSLVTSISGGIMSVSDLIIVTLLASGIMSVVKFMGGFKFLIELLTKRVNGPKGAEVTIVVLTMLTNICTANNTIAIITVGPIVKDIATRFGISYKKSASLIDTASCFIQGVIPYGAQLLMAAGLAEISPMEIIPHLYYPMLIAVSLFMSILISKKQK